MAMKIVKKEILTEILGVKITKLEVLSPDIAKKAKPGQFVTLMVSEEGERIPLTVVDKDKNKGTISLIFQEVGLTTKLLGKLSAGDSLYALVGPLGHPTEIKNYGKVVLAGGGVGIAEIYPVGKALKEAGNYLTTILGVRTKELLILEKELKEISDDFYITTDDGSYGKKGFVTNILQEILNHEPRTMNYELIYAVGPIPMMRRVSLVTKSSGIKTVVSLNALMVDATGMCGCCRVSVGGKTQFSCIDGPEFDAQQVDWQELEKRNRIYEDKEKHICELYHLS
jgi:ferredoxin--NADP+ reductase